MKTKKKTDKNKVERLFLYCLGMSPLPMSITEIEDAVEVKNPGSRQNYVYEVRKKLSHDSPYTPGDLIFTEDDFLTKESDEFVLESERFRDKVFDIYKDYFDCENRYELHTVINEKEKEDQKKIKGIQISDHKNNYIRVEINFSDLKTSRILKKEQIKFLQKSKFSDLEIELNLYARREKGRLVIRKFKLIPNFSFLDYIDIVSTKGEEKYVLNLRGLLYLFLIYDGELDVISVEKIVSNISSIDEYINLESEIDSAYGAIYRMKKIDDNRTSINKIFGSNSSYQVKKRFPFLSFYDCYKDYIHTHNKTFISDFILDVAQDFKRQLRNMSITKLKYEVTERYLVKIRRYFYSFHTQRLVHNNLSAKTFHGITRLHDEIGLYIEEMKKADYEWEKLERQQYEKENVRTEFKRKFKTLTYSNANVISLKEILSDRRNEKIIIDQFQINIIERFCKYGREDEDLYSSINFYVLIKNSLLKEIAQNINQNNYENDLQLELHKNGIPLDCKKDVKNWIDNHSDPLVR